MTLRSALCETPVLKLPDFSKPFVMEPDASDLAIAAVFLQEYDDGFHSIAYFSKKYLLAERNYAPHDRVTHHLQGMYEMVILYQRPLDYHIYQS